MCAKNYQNRDRFDKDIAKIKQGSFLASHGIYIDGVWWLLVTDSQFLLVQASMPMPDSTERPIACPPTWQAHATVTGAVHMA